MSCVLIVNASISRNASGDINITTTYATLVFISCDADNKPIRGSPILSRRSRTSDIDDCFNQSCDSYFVCLHAIVKDMQEIVALYGI